MLYLPKNSILSKVFILFFSMFSPYRLFFSSFKLFLCLLGISCLCAEVGKPMGSLSVELPAGTPDFPTYKIISPSVKGKVVFRGQVKLASGDNVSFHRVPDQLDPTVLSWPFKPGMLSCEKARAEAVIDSNQSILQINVLDGGSGYLQAPEIIISMPSEGNESWYNYEPAYATATINAGSVSSILVDANYSGKGYGFIPQVEVEGGVHFLKCVEKNNINEGKFFRIISNTGDTLTLDNSLSYDLSTIFSVNSMVEVIESWTLGSFLGYSNTSLNEGNVSLADYVYLLKPINEQNGTNLDYKAYFHDGSIWKDTNGSSLDASGTIIYPDESFILARRSPQLLELELKGVADTSNSFVQIPPSGKRMLMNNPFGVDAMLSDLIPPENLTKDTTETNKWFVSINQENADNIEILKDGVWTTYWHDGTNMNIIEKAYLTARKGTGVAGSITSVDISMSSGTITGMSNPHTGNIVVTSPGHLLRRGFTVYISGAYGYKTNQDNPKQQVDEDGNIAVSDADSLLIYSAANGLFEITNVTPNTFELLGKSGNCNFTGNNATWRTGSAGSGYEDNAYVVFVGGGGQGAAGIAHVRNGSVQSVTITSPGYGYVNAPKAIIYSGGWRRLGAGNSPFNDASVPAGSGILLSRNHPNGQSSLIRVSNPVHRF